MRDGLIEQVNAVSKDEQYGSSDGSMRGFGYWETSWPFWGSMIPLLYSGGVVMARKCRTHGSSMHGIHHRKCRREQRRGIILPLNRGTAHPSVG